MEFNETELKELIEKTQNGIINAEEKIFTLLLSELTQYAIYCTQYYQVSGLDQDDFMYAFFFATRRAIMRYSPEGGPFINYLRAILMQEGRRVAFAASNSKTHMQHVHCIRYDSLPSFQQDIVFNSLEAEQSDIATANDIDSVTEFIDNNFPDIERKLFYGWLSGVSFADLARRSNLSSRQVSTRVYRILETVREKFVKTKVE